MTARQPSTKEIATLTSVRGLGAFWVVLFHLTRPGSLGKVLPEARCLQPLLDAGVFAVPLFFILSGYVLGLRYLTNLGSPTARTLFRFWGMRLGRVWPVHFCMLLATLLLVGRHGWPADEEYSVGSFLENCFLVHAWHYDFHLSWNYPSWSLSSEWFAYLVFPLVAVFLARVGRRSAASLVVVSCCLSMVVFAFEKSLAFRGIAVVIPTFVGGVGLSVVCPPCSSRWGRRAAELGLVMVVFIPFVIGPGPILSAAYLALSFVLVAALGLAGDQSGRLLKSRPFAYLGEISYSLYMTHVCLAIIIFRFLPLDGLGRLHLGLRVFALFGILSIIALASLAVYYTVERPFRNLSRQMGSTSKGRGNQGQPNHAAQIAPCAVTGSGERMEAIS